MKSSYEKDLKSVNTRSNLYISILILNETASSKEVLNGTWKLTLIRLEGTLSPLPPTGFFPAVPKRFLVD